MAHRLIYANYRCMKLDKNAQYVYRIGSDNQHRIHWNGKVWRYEFLAGGVLFDELTCEHEEDLDQVLAVHGLTMNRFRIDNSDAATTYSAEILKKMEKLTAMGIDPCNKHGLVSKNFDNTCEACMNTDYPDDFKGTEG